MVAGGDHQGRGRAAEADLVEETPDQRVGEGQLAVVRPAGRLFPERRRREVRLVRIVEVDPEEVGRRRLRARGLAQPRLRRRQRAIAAPLESIGVAVPPGISSSPSS